MRVFKTTSFARFARKEGISDDDLKAIVDRLEDAPYGADLGGGVFKIRIARQGEGKSGGYRAIVFFKSGERTFYAYGFAKSDRDNINESELRAFRTAAKAGFRWSLEDIDKHVKTGLLLEI